MEGTPFGRYQLIELLGRGGMGEVWRAHDTAIDRVVALKMLLPHYAQDSDFEKRFRREARAAARLDDPHVVPIHDVGEIDGPAVRDDAVDRRRGPTNAVGHRAAGTRARSPHHRTDCLSTAQRSRSRPGVLAAARPALKAGRTVVIYPEGTRSTNGSVGEFRSGAL